MAWRQDEIGEAFDAILVFRMETLHRPKGDRSKFGVEIEKNRAMSIDRGYLDDLHRLAAAVLRANDVDAGACAARKDASDLVSQAWFFAGHPDVERHVFCRPTGSTDIPQ